MSFIATFGFTKAILNMLAGRWSDRFGRKPVLVLGWLFGIPVPFLLIFAASWNWVVLANVLLGVNQALTWTMTVTSKIDLVGPANRGLALGINEFSGYMGQASGGVITGYLAASYGLRPFPFYFGLASVFLGLTLSLSLGKETRDYALAEGKNEVMDSQPAGQAGKKKLADIFASVSWRDRTLFSCSQAGLVEKFTDTLVWAIYPLFLAARHIDIIAVALIVGLYQVVWGVSQLFTGALSDRAGRKPLIVAGMWLMSLGILAATFGDQLILFVVSSIVAGLGMALVYPVLLAAVSDVAHPNERGAMLGVYRFWRDSGYGFGALLLGIVADASGIIYVFYFTALALFVSGMVALALMRETLRR